MPRLTPIELEDGTTILIEATEDAIAPAVDIGETRERSLVAKDGSDVLVQKFKAVESTIRAYTNYTLNAFKQIADSNIDKITLEFGVNISGETGIPYVTKGTVASNMKITVECSFPKKTENTTGVPPVWDRCGGFAPSAIASPKTANSEEL